MKTNLFILFFGVLMMNSCTEEVKPTPYNYTKFLTGENSKTWKVQKFVIRVVGKEDETQSLNSCEKDDQYVFYNNPERLFEVNNGNSKCPVDPDEEPEPDQLLSYTWGFTNSGATITTVFPHIFGYFLIPFIVKKATDETMELEVFANQENTISYVVFLEAVDEN